MPPGKKSGMKPSHRTAIVAAAVAVVFLALVLARHAIVRTVLSTVLSVATGYHISIGRQTVGWSHAVFFDVRVSKNGDPVLDARRIDLDYALRDIFPGGEHRYGFVAIAIQKPVVTITRHRDGSLTFSRPGGTGAAPPATTRRAAAPYYFTARLRDGTIRLVDEAPLQPDLAVQTIANLTIDASVKSDERTTARVSGVWIGRRSQAAPLRRYPFAEHTVIDVHRGIGLNQVRADELPLRGALGFFVHSPAVRFDDGVIDGVNVILYALAPHPGDEMQYSAGGGLTLNGGRIAVSALASPIRDLQGHVGIAGDTLTADTLAGSVAGLRLQGRGAFYDIARNARAWLAISGNGDLAAMRSLFPFAHGVPLRGPVHVETLFASLVDDPLIHTTFVIPHVEYDRYPIRDVSGAADVYGDAVVIRGVNARFGSIAATLAGRVLTSSKGGDDIVFALDASGRGSALPYADMLAPDSTVHATALLAEIPGVKGWRARGTIDATGPTDGGMTFAVDEKGVGEFGPLVFTRRDGTSLAGGFRLERTISQSAGWIEAHRFRLGSTRAPVLPGVEIPAFPPIAGVIDGALVAGGPPSAFSVAGTMRGRALRYQDYAFGDGQVSLAGTFDDLRLHGIAVDGPLGRFRGDGGLANGVFALEGTYDAALSSLQPFFGRGITATGGLHGPVRATFAGDRIVVQTPGAAMRGARVRGIPLQDVAGTLLVQGKALRVVAADANVGGGRAVIADAGGPFVISAPAIPATALRGAGLPLDGGALSLFGLANLTGSAPRFEGTIGLSDGRAQGFPISGGADLAFDGRVATVTTGNAALAGTYGDFSGRIGVAPNGPSYDLVARVPLGEIGDISRAMRLPLPTLEGSFSADVRVRGSGATPRIVAAVVAPEGSYNGLAFRDVRGTIDMSRGAIVARNATVSVHSTRALVNASIAGRAFNVNVRSDAANLADFNEYFNEAETLAGTGALAFDLSNDGATTRTSGHFALQGVRFRRFPFGTTQGTWSDRGGRIDAALDIFGPSGNLRANGSVIAAHGDTIHAFTAANLGVRAAASNVDLETWLPPFGITAPVLGRVDASATVAGRWPRLDANVGATLHNGSLLGYAVKEGTLHARGEAGRIGLSNTVLDLGFARFDAAGSFGLSADAPLALSIRGQTADIGRALRTVLGKQRFDVAGSVQADARIAGTLRRPSATVGFDLTDARYRTLVIPRVLGSVAYANGTLDVRDAEATFQTGNAFLAGTLPISLRQLGIRRHAPFSFTLALGGVDLAPFAPLVPSTNTKLGGTVDGRLAIEGTTDAPRIFGTMTLANGSYVSDFDRARIADANASLTFSGTSVALDTLQAKVGSGTVDGRGRLILPFANAPRSGYAIAIAAHRAGFDLPQYGSGKLDGNLRLSRRGSLPLLSGNVTLSDTSIPFSSIVRQITAGGGTASGGPPFDLAFDLVAHAGKNVRVQGSIIDVGAMGTLALTGTLADPKLDGTISATPGGVFSTYNHAFRIQQATVSFRPAEGIDPYIDARAFAHVTNPDPDPARNPVGSADITISVNGPADELANGSGITYSSSPPYDSEQIVGLLLDASVFGAVNFGQQQNATILRGAPGVTNPLLPPGVTPYQAGVVTFNEEAFSLLNGQLVQRFLAPLETFLTGPLGLSDLELTVDYGGGVGYEAYKQIGRRDVYANFGERLTAPTRWTLGFTARPDAVTSIVFNYYHQNGVPAITTGTLVSQQQIQQLKGISPLTSPGGFSFSIVRKYP
jgi:autotransporter translocation and assembly factor TamB